MLSKIRGILALIQFSITVAFVVVGMYTFRKYVHNIIKLWMKIQISYLGITLEQEGVLDDSCDMVIINHQSLVDIIVIEHLHPKNLAWVGKKEITDLPFFGHIMKAPEMITVDRNSKAGLIKLLKDAKDRLSKGRPIAMFPEGTRSDGTKLFPFKKGAATIANKLELKVQPVVIINTRKILDSQTIRANPGVVKVIFLEPVKANKDTTWFKDSENKMKDILNKELQKENK